MTPADEHETDHEAEPGESQAAADDEAHHVLAPRAERHPHADLARAERDEVRQHAVEPDGGEQQRERAGQAQERRRGARREERRPEVRHERLHLVHRQRRVERRHLPAHFGARAPSGSPAVRTTTAIWER